MFTHHACSQLMWNEEIQLPPELQDIIDKLKRNYKKIDDSHFETDYGRNMINDLLVINMFPNLVNNILTELNVLNRMIAIIGNDIVHDDALFENRCMIIASYIRNLENYDNVSTLDVNLENISKFLDKQLILLYRSVDPEGEHFRYHM